MKNSLFEKFVILLMICYLIFLIQIICFFYEFLNFFDEVNLSDCYAAAINKPKFGPYIPPQCTLEVITL